MLRGINNNKIDWINISVFGWYMYMKKKNVSKLHEMWRKLLPIKHRRFDNKFIPTEIDQKYLTCSCWFAIKKSMIFFDLSMNQLLISFVSYDTNTRFWNLLMIHFFKRNAIQKTFREQTTNSSLSQYLRNEQKMHQ